MPSRVVSMLASGSSGEASASIARGVGEKLGGEAPALLFVFASTAQPLGEVAAELAGRFPGATVLGASTAGEFVEGRDAKGSVAALAVAGDFKVFAGMSEGLRADPEATMARALEGLPQELEGYPHKTAVLLLDPLAGNGEEATLLAAALLGGGVRLAGGAAGDDLRMSDARVACGARAAGDAAVVALIFSKSPLGVGVCHGHRALSRPLKVTRASGNVVSEIEGRPAFEVWLEETAERARAEGLDPSKLSPEQEGSFLLRYEGALTAGNELKVRAPLARSADGSISFACGVPEGTVLRITESTPERQIESAREAARRAKAQLGGPAAGAVVFDCICRNLILQGGFARAVGAMSEELGGVPLAGFETYGEIALDVGDMSGFHNTTSVVLAFPALRHPWRPPPYRPGESPPPS